ncbi:hypothetical protein M885DRAFT_511964 [Pelagophyceae sp. CCMP2097]|nr:hypothetical protein M885DRAFT_511964 [Pelagophyceae sp. CCMP2097]
MWSNPALRQQVQGDAACCGMLLVCWPLAGQSSALEAQLGAFRRNLQLRLPASAFVPEPKAAHCTVATLRHFTNDASPEAVRCSAQAWTAILNDAKSDEEWPNAFRLVINKPTFEGATAIFRVEDADGAIEKARKALMRAIDRHGGVAAVGSADRSKGKPPSQASPADSPPHVPDVCHITALRWLDEPREEEKALLKEGFEGAAENWVPIVIDVDSIQAVYETRPYMSRASQFWPPMAAQSPADVLWDPSWSAAAGERTILKRAASNPTMRVRLYCSWFCPFAQRAWIALEALNVDYEYVEINPYEVDATCPGGYTKKQLPLATKRLNNAAFVNASPRGLVPAVDCRGDKLSESLPLIEYLDETFGPSLLNCSPLLRAKCRIAVADFDSKIQKKYYTLLMEQDASKVEEHRSELFANVAAFGAAMAPVEEGPFFLGAQFSLLEVAAAPFWQRILLVGSFYRGLHLPDGPDFDRLRTWWAACEQHPAVANTLVCTARLISSYKDYATNTGTSDCARGTQENLSEGARALHEGQLDKQAGQLDKQHARAD